MTTSGEIDPLERLGTDRAVIGMVHLPALPGSPSSDGNRDAIRRRALADAHALESGGVDAILVENFGDAPFYPDEVPTHVVAEMTALAGSVSEAVDVPIGINVLRNDAHAALSVAAAVDAAFVRVNVHVGTAATDQGLLEGRAHETLRLRDRIDANVAILADVHVKHATPIGDTGLERAALETVERGKADGVIVSGPGTGAKTPLENVTLVTNALSEHDCEVPVIVGSGVTPEAVSDCFDAGADGVIVGTAVKCGGETTNPVSETRVRTVVSAAMRTDTDP
ncbi:BtpA/SgcQ family protein [Natrarchaeobaculum sulfurireducens]|uniref:Photosystem I biogenesis protein BtpA n=1 Tax=Natrarchaeobaculum sulfurireducens TaxID=2044521 RepID=A0A346PQQ4_9EURY|nr:BtpA/SgcQ family protein [Natrarchaeobaculum sulfurireducens]AXR81849.1 photosystem I biogenesis protein BtpA [Natrarchaeobaculum sulfurireducens]